VAKIPQQPSPENLAFASELIKARNDIGLTQSQLSAQSDVSLSAIKGYETGRNMPGSRELRDLCKTLLVTPNKLLFGVESPFITQGEADPAKSLGDKGFAVQRGRIAWLASLLSYDESYAVYSIVHSIATARHGDQTVKRQIDAADFETSIKLIKEGKGLEVDLLPKNPKFLRELLDTLKYALKLSAENDCNVEVAIDHDELIKKV
jgi:transcriptional regulator with XRE-family HTH domain